MDYRGVDLKILHADVLNYPSDVLVLKYAQASYGVDAKAIRIVGIDAATLPVPGSSLLVRSADLLASRNLLFLGVEPITAFDYKAIRDFSRRALALAEEVLPPVREISMTLHGPGFGLDEIEAFESEIAGVIDALDRGEYPNSLAAVTLVEQNEGRCLRLRSALRSLLGADDTRGISGDNEAIGRPFLDRIDSVRYGSGVRPHAFVAMPFAESFEDVLYYGISPPVRAAGLLCERMDQIRFTGSVIDRMKDRIASAAVVVADLSDANPNVYLEVGFAWGVRVPCILICSRKTDLKFDLKGERSLFYGSIMELEKNLSAELAAVLAVK